MVTVASGIAQTFTTQEVADRVQVPYRTVARWAELGDILLEGYTGRRRVPAVWSEKNLREASILAQLRRVFSMRELRDVMKYLRQIGHNPFSTGQFLVVAKPPRGKKARPRDLVKICETGEAIELMRRNRGQILLPIWPFAEDKSAEKAESR